MDDNTIIGAAKTVRGRVERVVGAVTGDSETEATGKIRELGGAAQQTYGQAADAVRQATTEAPLTSLLTAAGIGLMVGLFLNRR